MPLNSSPAPLRRTAVLRTVSGGQRLITQIDSYPSVAPDRHLVYSCCSQQSAMAASGCACTQLLERQEVRDGSNPCIYRISQEGLPFLLPHLTKQRLHLPLDLFMALITQRVLRIPKTVPYTTVRPPNVAKSSETVSKTPEEVAAAAAARPDGGFAATASGQPATEISCPEAEKELAQVCAGCCVVMLR